MPVRVVGCCAGVGAGIPRDAAVVRSVEIDALAVDLFEAIASVDRVADVSGGIDRDRRSPTFHIDNLQWPADAPSGVAADLDIVRVTDLQGIAADSLEAVVLEDTRPVPTRFITR